MGEVYRATDSNLKRSVAIKVLPSTMASDVDRLARFQREAEVLAALNHPNIAAIYGFERWSELTALVMELVDGEDLSQRIARGAIPIEEALPIAKQIAEALEAAHEQGIIHRDLKPANIKVRADGTVKVLDFGLAKAMDVGAGVANELSMSPTLSIHATQAGIVLGTAAYMAPEQARGKSVDRRADIWAFGVVLFEMLTSCQPFPGDDISHVLARVIEREPDWTALPAALPPSLGTYLRRCLVKDPRQRVRDIGDMRLALEGAFETVVSRATDSGNRPTSALARTLPWVISSTLAIVTSAVLLLSAPWRAHTPADRPLVRLDVDLGTDVSLPAPGGAGGHVAISPDGTRLVYVSGTPTKLFTRRLDQPRATELPGSEGAQGPFFSSDGQWVGFVARGKLSKISVEGGAAVRLSDLVSFFGASWSEDDSIILSGGQTAELVRVPSGGGSPGTLASLGTGDGALVRPQVLPGGKAVLFTTAAITGSTDIGRYNIEVLTLADRHRKIVARGGSTARYLPTSSGIGHLVYTSNATLFAVPFDLEKLETRGTAIPVLDDMAYNAAFGAVALDVSRTGTLVYRRAGARVAAARSTLQWVDAAGKTRAALRATPGVYGNPRLSPDGTRVALTFTADAGLPDVWVYDVQRDAMTRLTFVLGDYRSPIWSPDSQYVVFGSFPNSISWTRADGASQPAMLMQTKSILMVPWSFTPDGKRLAYFETGGNGQIWTVPLEDQGGQLKAGTPERFLTSGFNPSFSPDGRWLAYHSNESGTNEVYVRAFPTPSSGPGGKWQISNNGGIDPRWSRSGHELVYRSGDQILAASYTVKGDSFMAEKPRLWIAQLGAAAGFGPWDLAPDGKRVAVLTPVSSEAPNPEHEVVFLQNFFDELRRRVPLGK
jgi:serine/threonine-protein kinase